jgi:oxygen-independent coproporphyrinogen-3 oxidase
MSVNPLDPPALIPISKPPRAAYIHVPFCAHRCGYCNFTLVANRNELVEPYLQAIAQELALLGKSYPVDTLYFGGGTPTQLSCDNFQRLADLVLRWHPLADDYEWTVEANPMDVTVQQAKLFKELGVTRISLGVQSFDPQKLQLLERDHQVADNFCAAILAKEGGMQVAVDLIFGCPQETLSTWQSDIDSALLLEPDHISTYGLTFEKGTQFWNRKQKGQLLELGEDCQRKMYELAIDQLTAARFEHYEVSNFARSDRRSRHNQVYWSGAPYFAVGPGASRYVGGVRETNHRSTTAYLKRMLTGESPVAEREELSPEERARELLVFGLRRLEGVDREEFFQQTAWQVDVLVSSQLARLCQLDLLQDDGRRVRLTRKGLLVSDALWPELL